MNLSFDSAADGFRDDKTSALDKWIGNDLEFVVECTNSNNTQNIFQVSAVVTILKSMGCEIPCGGSYLSSDHLPNIGFELRLPSTINGGKYIVFSYSRKNVRQVSFVDFIRMYNNSISMTPKNNEILNVLSGGRTTTFIDCQKHKDFQAPSVNIYEYNVIYRTLIELGCIDSCPSKQRPNDHYPILGFMKISDKYYIKSIYFSYENWTPISFVDFLARVHKAKEEYLT